ncbi:hypothetical protein EBU91_01775 [bacterium]|nr:hypothetical protein [bacterium]
MENQDNNYGVLFNSISLNSEEHLELILSTINKEYALFYLVESIKFAYSKGCFSIGESEIISKSLRVILKETKE